MAAKPAGHVISQVHHPSMGVVRTVTMESSCRLTGQRHARPMVQARLTRGKALSITTQAVAVYAVGQAAKHRLNQVFMQAIER